MQLDSGASHGDTRLVHMAFGQQLLDNKAELALGRIIAGDDFAALQLACTSLNQAICGNPIAANQSISFPTFLASTWGGRFKVKPDSNWYAQTGAYLVYPKLFEETNDFGEFGAPDGSGVLALGELGYLVGKNGGGHGLPGTYKLGGYYDSERLTDFDSGDSKRGTCGVYGMGQQMLYAENGKDRQGLSAFLALSYAPPDVNRIQFMAAGGLSYQAQGVPTTPSR